MKVFLAIFALILFTTCCQAQSNSNQQKKSILNSKIMTQPKLVVGIVVDQMRYDYLTRFYNKYGEGGFKRLVNGGFNCKNSHYNYVPTYTGPGHASIFTGATPKMHGVIANYWYDKITDGTVYCTSDNSVLAVGSYSELERMSPHRMKTNTFADENRLFTQMKGKTIGISIKDRGAILPAGHSANGAYWFRGKNEGRFITSTYYMKSLPKWVEDFNNSNAAKSYFKTWNTLYDISTYTESGDDLNNFENGFIGKTTATFPYDFSKLKDQNEGFDIIKVSPYGNNLVSDFAIAALEGEQLGKDTITDVLTISFSSTDYVGHNFGVNSKEIQDTYLRLDKDIEHLLKALDNKVGVGEYTVFLTSDHGAVEVPSYLKSKKIPAGYFDSKTFTTKLKTFVAKRFTASDLIKNISNNQVFLNRKKIALLNLNLTEIQDAIVNEIINYENIDKVYTAKTMQTTQFTTGIENLLQNGFNQKRSGDVIFVLDPAVISYVTKGSTHGSGLNYDTHVPLVFFGKGIRKGGTYKKTEITDIAPTISALLGISFPNAATGNVLEFIIK